MRFCCLSFFCIAKWKSPRLRWYYRNILDAKQIWIWKSETEDIHWKCWILYFDLISLLRSPSSTVIGVVSSGILINGREHANTISRHITHSRICFQCTTHKYPVRKCRTCALTRTTKSIYDFFAHIPHFHFGFGKTIESFVLYELVCYRFLKFICIDAALRSPNKT